MSRTMTDDAIQHDEATNHAGNMARRGSGRAGSIFGPEHPAGVSYVLALCSCAWCRRCRNELTDADQKK